MKKIIFVAMLLMSMVASAQTIKTSEIAPDLQLECLGMSANHRYICGLNVGTYRGFIWDTETGDVIENEGDYANCDFRTVTDDGIAVGILGQDDMVTTNAATFDRDGAVAIIDEDMSQAFAATPDGKLIVGCLLDEMWTPTACIWRDGVRTILPVPTQEEAGFPHDGANAQYVSADGKVIVGYLQDWMSSRPAIVWRQQEDGTYKYDFIARDLWELHYGDGKPYLRFQALGVSANGQWVCLAAQKEAGDFMPTPEMMVKMNLLTGEVIEMQPASDAYFYPETDFIYPSSIADDGTCVGTARDEMGYMRGVIWQADKPTVDLLANVFPDLTVLEEYDYYMHIPVAITADGKYISGFGLPITEDEEGALDSDFQSYIICLEGSTGIAEVKTYKLNTKTNYNLAGQRVKADAKGIIIRDGHKTVK